MIAKTVSVIIPTHNYERFIAQAIHSCLGQTLQGIEIIVVDDGSTDNTRSVVDRFGDRVMYIHQENRGVSVARNAGLERATGDFVCFLDADDYFLPDAIESMAEVLAENQDVDVVIGQSYGKEEKNGETRWHGCSDRDRISDTLYVDLLQGNFSLTSPLIRGDVARQFRFPPEITNGEDIAYYAKILFVSKAYLLAKPVLVIVRHPDCLHKNIEKIAKQGADLIPTLLNDPLYGGAIDPFRNDVKAMVYLSLFRSLYLAGRGREGRKFYVKALSSKPGSIRRFSYFVKYLRTFFHSKPFCGTLARRQS